jgi:hypothetical protein
VTLLAISHLGSRFTAAGAALATVISIASGGLAWLHLVINAGRSNFYDELSRYVDMGIAIGFGLGLVGAATAFAFNLH